MNFAKILTATLLVIVTFAITTVKNEAYADLNSDVWDYNIQTDTSGSKARAIESELADRFYITNNDNVFWYNHQLVNLYWKLWETTKEPKWFVKHIVYLDKAASFPDEKLHKDNFDNEKGSRNHFKTTIIGYANDSKISRKGTCQEQFDICFIAADKKTLDAIYAKYLK